MKVTVALHASFVIVGRDARGHETDIDTDALLLECDQVMEALLELEGTDCGIADSAVAVDLGRSIVEVSLVAMGDTFEDAEMCGTSCIRTAIHKGGGHTPAWNTSFNAQTKHSELITA